jgi:hypothetical protein
VKETTAVARPPLAGALADALGKEADVALGDFAQEAPQATAQIAFNFDKGENRMHSGVISTH